MTIGVDAGTLSVSDDRLKVGVYRVVFNLLRVLGQLDTRNSYRLYSFSSISFSIMKEFGVRMKNVVLKPSIGWFFVRLPIELQLHPVDVFLGVAQAIAKSNAYSIGFVYDLGFLHVPHAYPGSLARLKNQTEHLIKRSNHIIAISQNTKDDIQNHYSVPSGRITVAYPGINNRFAPEGNRFTGGHPYFLFVGALKPGKNVPTAIRAFASFLKQSKKKYDFIIIGGDYWPDPKIDQTIKVLRLEERVRLLGYVSDESLPMYYRGATSLVAPSLWEGFCLPAVEAMACGCPVIASSAGSLPEIVGRAGLLIDPQDEEGITQAMLTLSVDKKARKQMIAQGLCQVSRFSWNNFGKTVLNLILRS